MTIARSISLGSVILLVGLAVAPRLAMAAEPPGASSCSGCHTPRADLKTGIPRLEGMPAVAIIFHMKAFKDGRRPATVMDRIAKGFSDEEIKTIADWYAARLPRR